MGEQPLSTLYFLYVYEMPSAGNRALLLVALVAVPMGLLALVDAGGPVFVTSAAARPGLLSLQPGVHPLPARSAGASLAKPTALGALPLFLLAATALCSAAKTKMAKTRVKVMLQAVAVPVRREQRRYQAHKRAPASGVGLEEFKGFGDLSDPGFVMPKAVKVCKKKDLQAGWCMSEVQQVAYGHALTQLCGSLFKMGRYKSALQHCHEVAFMFPDKSTYRAENLAVIESIQEASMLTEAACYWKLGDFAHCSESLDHVQKEDDVEVRFLRLQVAKATKFFDASVVEPMGEAPSMTFMERLSQRCQWPKPRQYRFKL